MNIQKQNAQFDATEGFSKAQREYLISQGRIALTRTRLTKEKCVEVMGAAAFQSDWGVRPDKRKPFGGRIITKRSMHTEGGWAEAVLIATERGWGEEIEGRLSAVIPQGDQEHAGLDTKRN